MLKLIYHQQLVQWAHLQQQCQVTQSYPTSKKVVKGNVQHKVHYYYNKSMVDPSLNKLNSAEVDRLSSLNWNCSQKPSETRHFDTCPAKQYNKLNIVVKQLVLLLQIWEAPGSKPGLQDDYLDKVLLRFSSFSPDKCQHSTSNKITNTSFLNTIFSFLDFIHVSFFNKAHFGNQLCFHSSKEST